jgi:FtsH ternary system domain X2
MCNPRRVEVTATRQLVESWQHEIRRLSMSSGTAIGEVRVCEALDDSIGAVTLDALVAVLSRTEGWELADGVFRYDLDANSFLAFHVDEQELEIVVRLSDEVSAQAAATATASGEINEEIEATGVGRYYDDEWGGVTEGDAREAARRHAEQLLEARGGELTREAMEAAEAEHDEALRALADRRAAAALAEQIAGRTEALRAEALSQMAATGIQARAIFHQALAEAFRDAIVGYAREHGAEGLSCSERDGVVDIQFEISV